MVDLGDKLASLKSVLSNYGSIAVGFSGGVDSTFLTAVAVETLGNKCLPVIVKSATLPQWELEQALNFVQSRNLDYRLIEIDILAELNFTENPPDRCFHCKLKTFNTIIAAAEAAGIDIVADGTNADDPYVHRPGLKALQKLHIISPLREVGLIKTEIRLLSRQMGLPTYDKPSSACLASRFPYGHHIDREKLLMVENAELFLHSLGYDGFRVRHHGDIARIELNPADINPFMDKHRQTVINHFKILGFKYIALDLEGYRTGSLNEVL